MKLAELVGQERAAGMLSRSLRSERLHHSLLFTGPEGVGKWTAANAVAAALLCAHGAEGEPCGSCPSCRRVEVLQHPEVHYIMPLAGVTGTEPKKRFDDEFEKLSELLAARRENPFLHSRMDGNPSLSVAWVREIQRILALRPISGGKQVVILRSAEQMNAVAANALLKTLEEPPRNCVIILTTASPAKLLPTVLSRCQRVPFRDLGSDEMEEAARRLRGRAAQLTATGQKKGLVILLEGLANDAALELLPQAGGSPGRWVQMIAGGIHLSRQFAFELLAEGIGRDIPARLERLERLEGLKRLDGPACSRFLDALQVALRDILAKKSAGEIMSVDCAESIGAADRRLSAKRVTDMLELVLERRRLFQHAGTRNVNAPLLMAVTLADLAKKGG